MNTASLSFIGSVLFSCPSSGVLVALDCYESANPGSLPRAQVVGDKRT